MQNLLVLLQFASFFGHYLDIPIHEGERVIFDKGPADSFADAGVPYPKLGPQGFHKKKSQRGQEHKTREDPTVLDGFNQSGRGVVDQLGEQINDASKNGEAKNFFEPVGLLSGKINLFHCLMWVLILDKTDSIFVMRSVFAQIKARLITSSRCVAKVDSLDKTSRRSEFALIFA
jgi:hypothetical protein